jgi:O-antigen ligase
LKSGDIEGDLSNGYRIREAKSLFRHIRQHLLFGSGFGAIATDYNPVGYRYELSFLDLLFKTGIVGLLLFLSFPLRLIWDALRSRIGEYRKAAGATPRGGAVVVAIIVSVMLSDATNPYLFSAFGLLPILAAIAWLEPAPQPSTDSAKG